MTKSGIDSQNSVSNSPVVPELKADFLERERVDNGDETWWFPYYFSCTRMVKTVQKVQQGKLVDMLCLPFHFCIRVPSGTKCIFTE